MKMARPRHPGGPRGARGEQDFPLPGPDAVEWSRGQRDEIVHLWNVHSPYSKLIGARPAELSVTTGVSREYEEES